MQAPGCSFRSKALLHARCSLISKALHLARRKAMLLKEQGAKSMALFLKEQRAAIKALLLARCYLRSKALLLLLAQGLIYTGAGPCAHFWWRPLVPVINTLLRKYMKERSRWRGENRTLGLGPGPELRAWTRTHCRALLRALPWAPGQSQVPGASPGSGHGPRVWARAPGPGPGTWPWP